MKKIMIGIIAIMLIASAVALNYKGSIDINIEDEAYQSFENKAISEGKTAEQKANEILQGVIEAQYLNELEEQMHQELNIIYTANDAAKYKQAISCLEKI